MSIKNDQMSNGTLQETSDGKLDVEENLQKLSFPKSILFIVGNEFCERYMINGMRAILVIYLSRELLYDADTATIIYHTFVVTLFFLSVFGAIISDSWLGKYRTILYLSIVYAIGGIILTFGAIPPLNLPAREMTLLGLFLIALGAGGIKPCVSAFGADQFKLPEQLKQMSTYFTIFYFSINLGSFLSALITPILRNNVRCFDHDNCFALAFGVPSILMIISLVIFCIFKFMYIIQPPAGNMVALVSKCIGNAISTRMKSGRTTSRAHWLDYAEEKYDQQLINDIKALLRILVLYIPLTFFWALFSQRGSKWTFQATRMNGHLGSFEIKPDQIQVINPFLCLLLIPIVDRGIYPMLSKIGIRRPLQKLALGGILAGVALLISGIVELELEKTYPVLPEAGEGQLRFFNTHPCAFSFETDLTYHQYFILESLETFEEKHISVNNFKEFSYKISPAESNLNIENCPTFNGHFNLTSKTSMTYFIQSNNIIEYKDNPGKSITGDPLLRLLVNAKQSQDVFVKNTNGLVVFSGNTENRELLQFVPSTYLIYIGNIKVTEIKMDQGSVFTILIAQTGTNSFLAESFEIASANSMHMLWMIPQYVVITLGEIMFVVAGLAFSYTQAPASMKAAVQACWLVTAGFGNIIIIIISGSKFFDSQAYEFFLFAGLMFIDMCIFMILAWRFKSIPEITADKNI